MFILVLQSSRGFSGDGSDEQRIYKMDPVVKTNSK
jgi:hypothetical protein